ncbi:MAG: hypothetical protein P1U35_02885 [Cycloclasticus sp.]|nr:hypothetical protein [Cycloclasticus sp.]
MSKKKQPLPFDKRGGVVAIRRHLLESENYLTLRPQEKVLITLLQSHWKNEKPVDYGIAEAAKKIPCDRRIAIRAFKVLEERGFITLMSESMFNSRTQSKSRSWRLEWLPWKSKFPSNKWESWINEN